MKKPLQLIQYPLLASAFLFCCYETSASEPINISSRKNSIKKVSAPQNKKQKPIATEQDSTTILPKKKAVTDKDQISSEDFFFMNLFFLLK